MGLFSFLKSAGAKLIGNKAEENETKTAAPAANSGLEALKESGLIEEFFDRILKISLQFIVLRKMFSTMITNL